MDILRNKQSNALTSAKVCLLSTTILLSVLIGASSDECGKDCPDTYRPICANNNVTYTNWCYLDIARCRQKGLVMLYNGECGCSHYKECDWSYKPLCGSDKNDYENMCRFEVSKACRANFTLEVTHTGACEPDPSDPLCRSNVVCTANYSPVCGSDERTYSNSCGITSINVCKIKNHQVTVAYMGECSSSISVRPWMWIAILAIVALVIVTIACLLIIRKKKRSHSNMMFDDEKLGSL